MIVRYRFPQKAAFNRVVPKSKIYEHANPGKRVKELFVSEIEKISWSFKLAPETINLPSTGEVHEIQVFTVCQRSATLNNEVLQAIDKAIPSPIFFNLSFNNKIRYAAAYKRVSEADRNKWVISNYFKTDWISENTEFRELPVVLDLGALYQTILKEIIPVLARPDESIDKLIARAEKIRTLEKECKKLEARQTKEKQFKYKVEMNEALRHLKEEIASLKQ